MGIVAAFSVIVGVPLLVAAGLDGIQMTRLAKAGVIASVPVAAFIAVRGPLDLATELGLPVIALMVVLSWLFGFATGPLVRALMGSAIRFAKPS
jgi:hypothetical protein